MSTIFELPSRIAMDTYQITAIFEDAHLVTFPARANEVVYQAAYRSNVRLEHDCLEGACGSCKVLCTQGEFEIDDFSDEALSDAERAQGYTLLCRMKAKTPCVVELPYPSSLLSTLKEPQWLDATVVSIEQVASTVTRTVVRLKADGLDFLPGQYVHMSVPGSEVVRSYSFANMPGQQDLEFFQKVYEQGAMSDYLRGRAAVGDEIRIKGPAGHFYLRPIRGPVLMVAGGTGLAPMLAMLRSIEAAGPTAQPIHLIYGVNEASEFFAQDVLAGFCQRLPLTIERIAVSGSGWQGPTGHVTSLLRPELLSAGDGDAYLCGPPPMIVAATDWLRDNGISDARIHAERFVSST
ncbi:MAG TPA: 2Fe-2S iron-sulfur cluster binding domain-containing protein [Eoetvoesiella sp.]